MLAAQAALRQPPTEAKPQVDDLETRIRQLGQAEQNLIPSLRQRNNARLRIATMRDELLQAPTSKWIRSAQFDRNHVPKKVESW